MANNNNTNWQALAATPASLRAEQATAETRAWLSRNARTVGMINAAGGRAMTADSPSSKEVTWGADDPPTAPPVPQGAGDAPLVPQTPEDAKKNQLEAEVAAGEAALAQLPAGSDEHRERWREIIRKRSELAKARKKSSDNNEPIALNPQQRAIANETAPRGAIWSGSANYSSGERPIVMRTPDGRMWMKSGGYVSPIKDDRELNTLVSLDNQMFTSQQREQKNAAQEALLDSRSRLLKEEADTVRFLNNKMLNLRMESHQANMSPEQLEILAPLYGDVEMMEFMSQLPTEQAMAFLMEMEQLLLTGGSMDQARGVVGKHGAADQQRKDALAASFAAGISDMIKDNNAKITDVDKGMSALETKIASMKLNQEPTEEEVARMGALSDQRTELRAKNRRLINKREVARSEYGAKPPSIAQRNLDSYAQRGSLDEFEATGVGGTLYSIMDLVARDNGYDGLDGIHHESLAAKLVGGGGVELGMFISECQRKAEALGWRTSPDNTDMWVKAAMAHIVQIQSVEQIAALVDAVSKRGTVGLDLPERKEEDRAPGGGIDMARVQSSVRSLGPPPKTGSEEMSAYIAELQQILVGAGMNPQEADAIAMKVNISGSIDPLLFALNEPSQAPAGPGQVEPSGGQRSGGFPTIGW